MLQIVNTTTTANYSDPGAAVFPSDEQGMITPYVQGFVIVANASVFASVRKRGVWTPDTLLAPTTLPINVDRQTSDPDYIYGVRFRDGVAGTHAQVFGALFQAGEPSLLPGTDFTSTVSASGSVSGSGALITGIIPATGTTPTAGTGFTYTHTNGTGTYVFTFTTAFSAAPTILAAPLSIAGATNVITVQITSVAVNGFTATTKLQGTGATDVAFNFAAAATV